jgi:hypothetical protein
MNAFIDGIPDHRVVLVGIKGEGAGKLDATAHTKL